MALSWRARFASVTRVVPQAAVPLVSDGPEFDAELHPLARQYLAFRCGRLDGRPHSLEEVADRFGIDPAFAGTIDDYLVARHRLHLGRAGWRASLARP